MRHYTTWTYHRTFHPETEHIICMYAWNAIQGGLPARPQKCVSTNLKGYKLYQGFFLTILG